jgi:hypothetical protein
MSTSGIRYSRVLAGGLSELFYCWIRVPSGKPGFQEEFKVCRPEDFWRVGGEEKSYTEFVSVYVKPRGVIAVSLRSKEAYNAGVFELRAKLPRYPRGPMLWFGFEGEDLFGGGVVHFMWSTSEGRLKAFAGSFMSRVEMDLTDVVGALDSASYHYFKICRRRDLALWYVDDRLRAMAILGSGDVRDSTVLYNSKPYVIGYTRDIPALRLPILLDIDAGDIEQEYEWDIHPWSLRVFDGDPNSLLSLDLYVESSDNKIRGLRLERGVQVASAPFPGTLDHTQLVLLTSGKCRVSVESYVGGEWNLHSEVVLEPRRPRNIVLVEKSLLYRVLIEPLEEATVKEATVFLR